MKSNNVQIEDLLTSESFYNWVNRSNSNDIVFWEAWWKEHPQHHDTIREAINIIESISFEDKSFNSEEIVDLWKNIKRETIDDLPSTYLNTRRTSRLWSSHLMKAAAIAIPILLGTILYLYHDQTAQQPGQVSQQVTSKEIPRGQKLTVYLPDGSMVKLNAESKISYPKPFDEDRRVVNLDGEAFFEVTPNPDKPFIVVTKGIETRVVGTSFNISAYPDEDLVEVSVVTGEVSVKRSDQPLKVQPIALRPSEQATYSAQTGELVVSGFNPDRVLGWKEGTLYFNNATMEEFVAELERWYGIDIVVDRKMPIKKGIVGEFTNQSLEEILIGMHGASEFEYELTEEKLIIK